MKCEIGGLNTKVFSRGIHFLARIGDEIHFESLDSGLYLSTVNHIKTAYGSIKFEREFFSEYKDDLGQDDETQCKVSIRQILPVFRSLKQVERFTIELDQKSCRLVFVLFCRQKITKKHSIPILDFTRLDELEIPESFSNKITGSHKLMVGILHSFHKTCREIKFDVKSDSIVIKNHIDNENSDYETIRSNHTLRVDEFDTFSIKQEGSIAFTFSDFRAMVHFAEANEAMLRVNFDAPGEPLCMSCACPDKDLFVANLLVATMLHDMEDTAPDVLRSKTQTSDEGTEQPESRSRQKKRKRVIESQGDDNPFDFVNDKSEKSKGGKEKSDQINETEDKTVQNMPPNRESVIDTARNLDSHVEPRPSILPQTSNIDPRASILPPVLPSIPLGSSSYVSNTTSSEMKRNLREKHRKSVESVSFSSSIPIDVPQNPPFFEQDAQKVSEDIFFETEETEKTITNDNSEVIIPESGARTETEEEKRKAEEELQAKRKILLKNIIERRYLDPKNLPGANEILAEDSEGEETNSRLRANREKSKKKRNLK